MPRSSLLSTENSMRMHDFSLLERTKTAAFVTHNKWEEIMTWVKIASLLLLLSLPCFPSIARGEEGRSDPRHTQRGVASASGLFKTNNVKLNKILSSYSLGRVVAAGNLAVATIRSTVSFAASDKFLSLDEALKRKLLIIKEISSGGSVPVLKAISRAGTPIFLPFGSIVSGGKQDRMLREDVLLPPKESMNIGVYCIEQGRWRPRGRHGYFGSSLQQAAQSLKALGSAGAQQNAIWNKVRERNYLFGNPSASSNVQDNVRTGEFNKLIKQLEPVRDGVAKQERICGALVILDGKVVGTEIFAGPNYFSKIWPQLFNSYVIDAASRKEIVKTEGDKARGLAEAFLAKMSTAKVTEKHERDLLRHTIQSDAFSGHALVENRKGRLVYLGIFPKPKEVHPNMNRQQIQAMYQRGRSRSLGSEGAARPLPAPARGTRRLTAGNVAEPVGRDRWNWTVFIKGDRQDIDAIKCVEYSLHPSFPNPVHLVCEAGDPNRAFKLSATGWGTFTIGIRVFMKDGSHKDLKHRLKF